jgi:hypothetical protein
VLCNIKIEIYGMRRVHAAQKTLDKKYRRCFNINSMEGKIMEID